ncbi:ABC transporter permease [Sphingobacteriales bacterium UPWRP_1]|nr:ABC transporter permease [Sphingobacteriales bacterium UPWRP_1]
MRTLFFLLQKEFLQIFRDPAIVRLIFVMPVVQLLLLPLAADYEIKNISLSVVDHDHTPYSRLLIDKFTASGYFKLTDYSNSYRQALKTLEKETADLVVIIPNGFEKQLVKENKSSLMVSVNAVNGAKAAVAGTYSATIIRMFTEEVRKDWLQAPRFNPMPVISISGSNWYNPHMKYALFMVPGILAVLLTMVGSFLTALNIVREKEIGTIEQINVTPIHKTQFILGKLIPFWILGMIVLTLGLLVGRLAYNIVPVGNIGLIYAFASVYLLAVLGIGLLISTYADTQQQAMFVAFFFMIIFILMGGIYTPISSMPYWAQVITWFNPVSYFVEVMRMILLKGSKFVHIQQHLVIVACFAVVFNTWAIINYKKTT